MLHTDDAIHEHLYCKVTFDFQTQLLEIQLGCLNRKLRKCKSKMHLANCAWLVFYIYANYKNNYTAGRKELNFICGLVTIQTLSSEISPQSVAAMRGCRHIILPLLTAQLWSLISQ